MCAHAGIETLPLAVHISLLQDALPVVMATAWALATSYTQSPEHISEQQLQARQQKIQGGHDMRGSVALETCTKALYIQACGQVSSWIIHAVQMNAVPEASAAAALVSSLVLPEMEHCRV